MAAFSGGFFFLAMGGGGGGGKFWNIISSSSSADTGRFLERITFLVGYRGPKKKETSSWNEVGLHELRDSRDARDSLKRKFRHLDRKSGGFVVLNVPQVLEQGFVTIPEMPAILLADGILHCLFV